MKILKIIFGFGLLLAMGAEYANACKEIGSFILPGIFVIILLLLLLTTWLFGSGFSSRKFQFTSIEFFKFFGLSFVIFAIAAIVNFGTKPTPSHFYEIQGYKIPLGKCIKGNRRVIPDEKEREQYCKCFVEKIVTDPKLKEEYVEKLVDDQINKVMKEIQSSPDFLKFGIEDCMNSITVKWSDNVANSMKRQWKKQLVDTEFEETNDLDKYCDCLVQEYRKFPLKKIMEDSFIESEEAVKIDMKCTSRSKK